MKVSLVFPRLIGQFHGFWPPLGIILLGTILREKGHQVQLIDTSFDRNLSRAKAELSKFRPDVVGVSVLSNFLRNAEEVVSFSKGLGAITIMGGPHITIEPEISLQDREELDFIVRGEGEVILPALLEKIEGKGDFHQIPGIGFRDNGEVVFTKPADYLFNLDALPFADFGLLDTHKIYLKNRTLNVFAIRGCPFRCNFCQPVLEKMFGKKLRFRSPVNVCEELQRLHHRYGIRDFFFVDDVFTVRKSWLYEFMRSLEARSLIKKLRFIVNSRIDLLDEEVVRLLKAINCYYILLGVESGSQRILDFLEKDITVDQTREAFRLCKKYGIRTHAYLMLGAPDETQETLRETEKLIKEIAPTTLQISIMTPLKGTRLFNQCQRTGLLNPDRMEEQDYYTKDKSVELPIRCSKVTPRQVLRARARILRRRRIRVLFDGLTQTFKDVLVERRLSKLFFRMKLFPHLKHYWG